MQAVFNRKRNLFIFFLITASIGCFSSPSVAQTPQEGQDNHRIEEIVVTATRDAQEIRKVPANVTVITAEEIQQSGKTSIAEVLTGLVGVNVSSYSGNDSQVVVDMRGFGGEAGYLRQVIMLDGRRLNRPDLGLTNWLEIPLQEIERIEVVRGSSSVLYGDNAIAGAINIITKRGKGKPQGEVTVIGGSYGTQNERIGLRGSTDNVYYALSGENLQSDGYRDRSAFASRSLAGSVGYSPSDYLDLSLAITYNRTDSQLPGAISQTQLDQNRKQARNPDDDSRAEFFDANLLAKTVLGDYGRIDLNLIYGKRDVTSNYRSFYVPSYTGIAIDTIAVTPRYILEKAIFGFGNKLTVGFDYYRDKLAKDTYPDREETYKTYVADLKRETTGFYGRDEFNLMKNLIVTLGARQEQAKVSGNEKNLSSDTLVFEGDKTHSGEAYEASLNLLFGEKSNAWVKFASFFRFPSLDQQASYYAYPFDTFLTNLDKEKGKSYEAGVQLFPRREMKIGLTAYLIDMEDEISYNPITYRNENLDKTRHEGIELTFDWRLAKWMRLLLNGAYQNAFFRDGVYTDKKVPLVPEWLANAAVEFYLPAQLTLRPELRYVGAQFFGSDYDNASAKLDAYTIVNLLLRYQPDWKIMNAAKLSAFVAVNNLTNQKYVPIGYATFSGLTYYPAPEIEMKAGISLYF